MVESVAERGYDAVTVRGLARWAGVSTRAFYEHFGGKEECFLRTHDLIMRRVGRQIAVASQADGYGLPARLRLTLGAFLRELERDPRAARLALIEAYEAGPAALEQARRAESLLEETVAESFSGASDQIEVPPLLVRAIVAGVVWVARSRLYAGREAGVSRLTDELVQWVLSYRCEAIEELAELDRRTLSSDLPADASPLSYRDSEQAGAEMRTDDRALILSAVARLAATDGYGDLTARLVCDAAGTSRRSFSVNFKDVEDCFLAALESSVDDALDRISWTLESSLTWTGRICRAITTLCVRIAGDPILASLFAPELFALQIDGVPCRERLTAEMVRLIRESAPAEQPVGDLSAEASLGAIWGVIQRSLAAAGVRGPLSIGATLAYLATAPTISGPAAAVEAIREELQAEEIENTEAKNLTVLDRYERLPVELSRRLSSSAAMTTVTK